MASDKKILRLQKLHKNLLITVLAGVIVFLTVSIFILLNRRPGVKLTEITINGQAFQAEIADTPAKQRMGLMFRKNLPERTGMLFIFTPPEVQHFWMRNTYVPLDIIFIDDQKRIINICTMPPLTDEKCKSDRPAIYVLELEAGSAARYTLQPGQQVSINLTP
jgi:uncharacterized membrane protein (UPF0127 family)